MANPPDATSPETPGAARLIETRFGPMLGLPNDIYVTRSLELYGEYCPGEWALLAQLVRPGMAVVEVGANIGSHSVALAKACAPGPIHLFEPQQPLFQILCANLALNGVRNAIAWPEACGAADGWVSVPNVDYAAEGNFGSLSVKPETEAGRRTRLVALDSLALPACGLLKIDVEGFEPDVLRGAAETIGRTRPTIYVENDRVAQQQTVIDLVAGYGYDLYWHTPRLYSADNFKRNAEDVFPRIVSLNMLCLPTERRTTVANLAKIDPANWTSPVRLPGANRAP